jgi:hypothetical protein
MKPELNRLGNEEHYHNNKPLALVFDRSHHDAFLCYLDAWFVPVLGLYELYQ